MAEPEVEDALAFLRKVRDAAGEGEQTKLYVAAVDELR